MALFTASAAHAAAIPTGGSGSITVDNGKIFVTQATANNAEGKASTTPVTDGVTGVTVAFGPTSAWTTWSDPALYGDIHSILSVFPGSPGTITLTAPANKVVTLNTVDLAGSPGHGAGNIPSLKVDATAPTGSQAYTNVSFNAPTHNTLPINLTGSTLTLTFSDPNGDYGWEGLNNITFSVASSTPEPATFGLIGVGAAAWALRRRGRRA